MAESIRPKLEASAEALHALLGHIHGYEIEDNKVIFVVQASSHNDVSRYAL